MRKLLLTAAVIGLAGCNSPPLSEVVATDWVLVNEGRSEDKYYVDRHSIRTTGSGYKRVWVKKVQETPLTDGGTFDQDYFEFDCSQGRARFLQQVIVEDYRGLSTNKEGSPWFFVPPDNIYDKYMNYVCFGTLPE